VLAIHGLIASFASAYKFKPFLAGSIACQFWIKAMKFLPHGAMHFDVFDQILVARIGGPWNVEFVQAYQLAVQPYVRQLGERGLWALIIDVQGEAMCPPDALELVRQGAVAQHGKSLRACTSFVIQPDVPGAKLMGHLWRKVYAGLMPFEVFETQEEALNWSAQTLATLRADAQT
jgi:hypothetical protein